ncbi:hypothetical protein [Azotobacter beijerinckii]|uniref:Replication initiation factor n=1 Tax=Azotobacter beijerinckii TaxID=170623 RepID=A0A1I3YT75_9GAMM|nr:hypothetical protein [Azotobacter beijerinckii]SFA71385.1 hypothetical protein SAMN04244571_00141 [Azotobacter beijerinckii]SFK35117.1 hypothetical protein SAMN04244574_00299 [Azotobacter beijerinckii]
MRTPQDQTRFSAITEDAAHQRVFVDPQTLVQTDLSHVRLLRCAVDTVRQLYRGRPRSEVLDLFESSGLVEFAGYQWHAGRVGRDSGYQFKLQNADLGLIALVKNHNVKADSVGAHLKFEVSPHLIDNRSPKQLQELLDGLAVQLLTQCEANQCAVHLALDVQGWYPPADLVARMHCRARAQRDFSGVERIEYDERAAVYGRGKSFLFGSASGMQLAIYDKTAQARAIDKLDYWESVWRRTDNPFDESDPFNYDPAVPVWRIELRFHHGVVQQFADGSADIRTGAMIDTRTFAELSAHLQGLWQYGLQAFKLLVRPGMYDAFWTLIRSDVRVFVEAASLVEDTDYRRHYKTSRGFSGKNVELFLGNFVSLLVRERVGAQRAFERLQDWECWSVIRDHYAAKGKSERDIYRHIQELMQLRVVRWGRAV